MKLNVNEQGNVLGYVFWPGEAVEALFSKKTSPEEFKAKMKKLYRIADETEIYPGTAMINKAEELLKGFM